MASLGHSHIYHTCHRMPPTIHRTLLNQCHICLAYSTGGGLMRHPAQFYALLNRMAGIIPQRFCWHSPDSSKAFSVWALLHYTTAHQGNQQFAGNFTHLFSFQVRLRGSYSRPISSLYFRLASSHSAAVVSGSLRYNSITQCISLMIFDLYQFFKLIHSFV